MVICTNCDHVAVCRNKEKFFALSGKLSKLCAENINGGIDKADFVVKLECKHFSEMRIIERPKNGYTSEDIARFFGVPIEVPSTNDLNKNSPSILQFTQVQERAQGFNDGKQLKPPIQD